jgi:quercetin dioxygenase-like cupin family protein
MKTQRISAAAAVILGAGVAVGVAQAQVGSKRTDLQKQDLSTPGHEVIQARVDIGPGITAPRHFHPGEEVIYVLEGSLQYTIDGRPPVTLKAGDVYFIPARAVHSAKNVGTENAAELATYIVEKGKPLLELAK